MPSANVWQLWLGSLGFEGTVAKDHCHLKAGSLCRVREKGQELRTLRLIFLNCDEYPCNTAFLIWLNPCKAGPYRRPRRSRRGRRDWHALMVPHRNQERRDDNTRVRLRADQDRG